MNIKEVKRIDLGCGTRKMDGFFGIDIGAYEGVDLVQDLRFSKLPFDNEQIDEARASHFLEHLSFDEAIFFMNEVWRVLKPDAKFNIIVPHAMSYAQVADLSHKSAWTEDTFGYFTPENKYYYSWFYEKDGERHPVINKWKVLKNDQTPPHRYTADGWIEVKLREIDAVLQKLP